MSEFVKFKDLQEGKFYKIESGYVVQFKQDLPEAEKIVVHSLSTDSEVEIHYDKEAFHKFVEVSAEAAEEFKAQHSVKRYKDTEVNEEGERIKKPKKKREGGSPRRAAIYAAMREGKFNEEGVIAEVLKACPAEQPGKVKSDVRVCWKHLVAKGRAVVDNGVITLKD